MADHSSQLPIIEVLDPLREAFASHGELVLQAPPGAGKTTMVPLALLSESWLGEQKILMLEPRRMAAQAAARRMAQMLGEQVGETVGYRIRLDNCVGEHTRIEVITEGILTRRLQSDPSLEGVGLVIFDEFHERNLNSDLGLALTLHGRELFRDAPPLKILVMSATLDGEAVSELLGDAPIITSSGRQYPVTASYGNKPYKLRDSVIAPIVQTVLRALTEHTGNILVFLPGQGEIRHVARELGRVVSAACDDLVIIAPLYGGLSLNQQQEAVDAPTEGVRKIVLATNIAETSLTIEGIHTVVDSGLVREPVFDPATGMTRLDTRRVSRASAEQRMGRAGRLAPGHCYRLWSEEQHHQLPAQTTPEIRQADLASLTLQLLAWGVEDPAELAWLDAPASGPYQQSVAMLQSCSAISCSDSGVYFLTAHGQLMARMPLHPRLAHMLLVGCDIGQRDTACLLAAVLSERNPLASGGTDIARSLAVLNAEQPCEPAHKAWFMRTWKQARRFLKLIQGIPSPEPAFDPVEQGDALGVLLAHAYPDRVARLRDDAGNNHYQLGNGRSAVLPDNDNLVGTRWLAVAEVGGRVGELADRIYSATTLNPDNFNDVLAPLIHESDYVHWDDKNGKFVAEQRRELGKLLLSRSPMADVPEEARLNALLSVVHKKGLEILPWTKNLQQWRSRVMLLHGTDAQSGGKETDKRWPDLSDTALLASLEDWLSPYLSGVNRIEDFQKLDLKKILHALLPWPLPLELERQAPERLAVPSGSSIVVDYTQSPPVLQVKLQEMFGCEETPCIADGRIPLVVHLLSPAQRPLQITQDLAGFWRSSYQDVKKEMKGRYPKHPWPDDPLGAEATRFTKRRIAERA
ncbi:MAG: ATP-dependent helicase HrpB [Proteobacteria bacterium]|nr:ATP-dependent helicase HrpB [Pseudomonadota bacterium]